MSNARELAELVAQLGHDDNGVRIEAVIALHEFAMGDTDIIAGTEPLCIIDKLASLMDGDDETAKLYAADILYYISDKYSRLRVAVAMAPRVIANIKELLLDSDDDDRNDFEALLKELHKALQLEESRVAKTKGPTGGAVSASPLIGVPFFSSGAAAEATAGIKRPIVSAMRP